MSVLCQQLVLDHLLMKVSVHDSIEENLFFTKFSKFVLGKFDLEPGV